MRQAPLARRVRRFFRDGPRSLLRRRVPLEAPDTDRQVIIGCVGIAIALIALVIYGSTPDRTRGWLIVGLVALVLSVGAARLIARWPRDGLHDRSEDPVIFIPVGFALATTVLPIAYGAFVILFSDTSWGLPVSIAFFVPWFYVNQRYGAVVRAEKQRVRDEAVASLRAT